MRLAMPKTKLGIARHVVYMVWGKSLAVNMQPKKNRAWDEMRGAGITEKGKGNDTLLIL